MTDGRQYQAIHRAALRECEARLESRDREIDALRAENARLRHALERIAHGNVARSGPNIASNALATPPPEGEKLCPTCREADQPLALYYICDRCERGWKEVENGDTDNLHAEPNTPQAHGDALAALDELAIDAGEPSVGGSKLKPDQQKHYDTIRRHLTASGVPEELRRLPDTLRKEVKPGFRSENQVMRDREKLHAANRIEDALASAPADGWNMKQELCYLYWSAYHVGHSDTVDGRYTDVPPCDRLSYHEEYVDECLEGGDMPGLSRQIAAAPQRGGE